MRSTIPVAFMLPSSFGQAKLRYRVPAEHKSPDRVKHLHQFRDPPGSFIDYL